MSTTPSETMKTLDQEAAKQKAETEAQTKHFQAVQADNAKLKQAANTVATAIANDSKVAADLTARRDALVDFSRGAAAPQPAVQAKIDAYETTVTTAQTDASKAAQNVADAQKKVDDATQSVARAEESFTETSQRDTTISAELTELERLRQQTRAATDSVTIQMATYLLKKKLDKSSIKETNLDSAIYSDALNKAWQARADAYATLRNAQKLLDLALYEQQKTVDALQQLTASPIDALLATAPEQAPEQPVAAEQK